MGGDHGPTVTLPACQAFMQAHPQAELLLVGTADALAGARDWRRCRVVEASEVVTMDDPVEVALRRKKDSSMRVAISQLIGADGAAPAAQACVSAGNTGALMAVARYLLKTLDGIDRPAIATVLPNRADGYTTVLDLGANVDCTPEHLLQFAVLGSALVAAVDGKEEPSVGLLNIGEEVIKGSDTIKRAGELLRAAAAEGQIRFHGNVEGDDIFKGSTDIVVCDGFVGNIVLKSAEGLATMLTDFIRQEFTRGPLSKPPSSCSCRCGAAPPRRPSPGSWRSPCGPSTETWRPSARRASPSTPSRAAWGASPCRRATAPSSRASPGPNPKRCPSSACSAPRRIWGSGSKPPRPSSSCWRASRRMRGPAPARSPHASMWIRCPGTSTAPAD